MAKKLPAFMEVKGSYQISSILPLVHTLSQINPAHTFDSSSLRSILILFQLHLVLPSVSEVVP